ncbi:NADPH-dependent FMN reductase [Aureimonas flava]|uniref:NADPH-dependent FMN reductase n=1 Tax=Aureimonas flava TaxID=2320271 RepID=UPI00145A0061|nr:NADPH-dependent FMN reductase [Aureimonas flava]
MIPRILVLAGDTAAGSPAARLAQEATRALSPTDAALTAAALADYPLPFFEGPPPGSGHVEEAPQNARLLAQRLALQDGLLLVCPEINAGPPAALKNALDWAGAVGAADPAGRPPFARLVVALAATGAGGEDGRSALAQLRAILASLGADVLTAELRLAAGEDAFDASGRIRDPAMRARLDDLLDRLFDASRALGRQGG